MNIVTEAKRGNRPDVAFGISLIAIAGIALAEMRDLSSGTASEMGGGYVPRALCIFLLLMGFFYAVRGSLSRRYEAMPPIAWKSVALVCASIASFALALETLGLFIATLLMTIFASLAYKEHRWVEMTIFALGMSAFTVVVFITGLKLALPVWPVFFGN